MAAWNEAIARTTFGEAALNGPIMAMSGHARRRRTACMLFQNPEAGAIER
jgi:hypothetical protein